MKKNRAKKEIACKKIFGGGWGLTLEMVMMAVFHDSLARFK